MAHTEVTSSTPVLPHAHLRGFGDARPRRHRALFLSVLVSLGALGGLFATTADAQVEVVKPLKVVLVGDSFSAGNGAGDYSGVRNCQRSPNNWASLYVAHLTEEGHAVTFVNRACNGAKTDALTGEQHLAGGLTRKKEFEAEFDLRGESAEDVEQRARQRRCKEIYPDQERYEVRVERKGGGRFEVRCKRFALPQINAVDSDTDLVLMTFGGNDVGFTDIVLRCFAVIGIGFESQSPDGCRDAVGHAEGQLDDLEDHLVDVFRALHDEMRSDGRVALLTYPHLSEDREYLLEKRGQEPYDAAAAVRKLGEDGEATQRRAVNRINEQVGYEFVQLVDGVKDTFKGHEPDPRASAENPERWINEFDHVIDWTANYHPNRFGHAALAIQVAEHGTFGVSTDLDIAGGDLDLALVIDTTGSMGDDIAQVRSYATELVRTTSEVTKSARFALVTYRDHPEHTGSDIDYSSRIDQSFTAEAGVVQSAVDSLTVDGGGDRSESVHSGMMAAIGLEWRPGVKKILVWLGDAPPHEPEPVTGLTADDVVEAAFEVDPVEVYAIDTGGGGTVVGDIAERTNGEVFSAGDPADVVDALQKATELALSKPYAWAGGPYIAELGEEIQFDASGSYDPVHPIERFEWDLDGDGTYDVETGGPTHSHTYEDAIDGFMAVRVVSGSGQSAVGSTRLHVSVDGDEVPAEFDNCPEIANHDQGDEDGDGIGNACDETHGLPIDNSAAEEAAALATRDSGDSIWLPVLLAVLGVGLLSGGGTGLALRSRSKRPSCLQCQARLIAGSSSCSECGAPNPPFVSLTVIDGPDAGRVLHVGDGDVIGRGDDASVQLGDPSVSRVHARVIWIDEEWAILDVGSSTGVIRNGQAIARGRIHPGDVIELGATAIRVDPPRPSS